MGLKAKKKAVQEKLQKAVELELATIPPYLTAVFSIHQDANREAANIIRSVFMEEMLHLTLAANILTATGGAVALGEKNIPRYPLTLEFEDGETFMDREFEVDLARFSRSTMHTFMQIELPKWEEEEEGLSPKGDFKVDGYTIGDFYESIRTELEDLCNEFGEEKVFNGNHANQIDENYYWKGGGKPIVVKSMKNASDAIDEIIEQGEGASGSLFDGDHKKFGQMEEVAHYYRFSEIFYGKYYKHDDDPQKPPTGEDLAVEYDAVYPIKRNCHSSDFEKGSELWTLNNEFNRRYSLMLQQLEAGFRGNPKLFYTAIMNGMHGLLPMAYKMVKMPIPGDPKGRHGAPSFEWMDTSAYKDWHVVQTVKIKAAAEDVWDLVGGFFTIHTWHPDISNTEMLPKQMKKHAIRRKLTFPGQPKVVEQLVMMDNENRCYKYKWHSGPWGEKVQNYHAEIKVIETKPGKQCMVEWSSEFYYSSDALSKFYKRGFKALKKHFKSKK